MATFEKIDDINGQKSRLGFMEYRVGKNSITVIQWIKMEKWQKYSLVQDSASSDGSQWVFANEQSFPDFVDHAPEVLLTGPEVMSFLGQEAVRDCTIFTEQDMFDPCQEEPCLHGGNCVRAPGGSFECRQCYDGFRGNRCHSFKGLARQAAGGSSTLAIFDKNAGGQPPLLVTRDRSGRFKTCSRPELRPSDPTWSPGAGVFFNGAPLLCGGEMGFTRASRKCFRYQP